MVRTRQRIIPDKGGKGQHPFYTINQSIADGRIIRQSTCTDDTGKKLDHALSISHQDCSGSKPLNGIYRDSFGNKWEYTNFSCNIQFGASMSHSFTSAPSAGSAATTVLARSNPSRPVVSIPNFVYELKDLPGMIREIGHIKLQLQRKKKVSYRDVGNYNLAVAMGWSPLISDLRKLLDFQAQTARRVAELNRLYSNKGLRRRISIGTWSGHDEYKNVTIESQILSILADISQDTVAEMWGTVRWQLTNPPSSIPTSTEQNHRALALISGFGAPTLAVWNALPWTWLVDWFTNSGEYLQAHSNYLFAVPNVPNIMKRTVTQARSVRRDAYIGSITGGDGVQRYETKERFLSSGSLTATLPFLTGRQLSIISSLALQRIRL